jgi:hypothetical protein
LVESSKTPASDLQDSSKTPASDLQDSSKTPASDLQDSCKTPGGNQKKEAEERSRGRVQTAPLGGAFAPAVTRSTKRQLWYEEQCRHIDEAEGALWSMSVQRTYLDERWEAAGQVIGETCTPKTASGWFAQARWLETLGEATARAVLQELQSNGYKRLKNAHKAMQAGQQGTNGRAKPRGILNDDRKLEALFGQDGER